MKLCSESILSIVENAPTLGRQILPATIDMKVEHRHRRAKRISLAAPALRRRALQRFRNRLRAGLREHASFEIECITSLHHSFRPLARRLAARGLGSLLALACCAHSE